MGDQGSLDDKLASREFVDDFVWSARAIFSQPSVLLVTVALWSLHGVAISLVRHAHNHRMAAFAFMSLVFTPLSLGWDGVERMFFLRRREGRVVTLSDLLASTPTFIGRFVRLGCLVVLATSPLQLGAICLAQRLDAGNAPLSPLAVMKIGSAAQFLVIDLALTFVTSALVFTTPSVWRALRIGLRMIRQTWPRSLLYVLCPPLALNAFNTIYSNNVSVVRWVVTTAVLTLLALMAKGATAAFYLRERSLSLDANPVQLGAEAPGLPGAS
jgi:hypothetical protein